MDRTNLKVVMSSLLGLAMLMPFQNCSEVGFDQIVKGLQEQQEHEGFLTKRQTEVINASSNTKLDILFVVDNSGSMVKYQQNMADRISGFMDYVRNLDYQIAVTSTGIAPGPRSTSFHDGQFRAFEPAGGGPFKILEKAGTPNSAEADLLLQQALQMGTGGDGTERGIQATYRAIERSENAAFFRTDAKLAVVLISDEDECSNGNCSSQKSDPEKLIELVNDKFGIGKVFTFHSIIHPENPGFGECPDKHNSSRFGRVYKRMSELTQGIVGSVCESNYANQLAMIGQGTESLLRTVKLHCSPQDVDNDGKPDIVVYRNGQVLSDSYSIAGDRLTFDTAVGSGAYVFDYYCKK